MLLRLVSLRGDDDGHDPAFHHHIFFNLSNLGSICHEPIQQRLGLVPERHFPALKKQVDPYFIFLIKERQRLLQLGLIIMLLDMGLDPDLLELGHMRMLLGAALLLFLLVFILAEIHDPAHRWLCRWSYFNKVKLMLIRKFHGPDGRNHAELFRIGAYDTKLTGTDLFVNTDPLLNNDHLPITPRLRRRSSPSLPSKRLVGKDLVKKTMPYYLKKLNFVNNLFPDHPQKLLDGHTAHVCFRTFSDRNHAG